MTEPLLEPNYDPRVDGAMREKGAKLVRPRDAATLIIVRRDAKKPRLLMGRRHGGHDFMPDKWVFPGGRIDRSDFRAPYATDLRPEVAARLAKTAPVHRARALALTAVRETFEEAGLLLAKAAPPRAGAGPFGYPRDLRGGRPAARSGRRSRLSSRSASATKKRASKRLGR